MAAEDQDSQMVEQVSHISIRITTHVPHLYYYVYVHNLCISHFTCQAVELAEELWITLQMARKLLTRYQQDIVSVVPLLKQAFTTFDRDGDDKVDEEELQVCLHLPVSHLLTVIDAVSQPKLPQLLSPLSHAVVCRSLYHIALYLIALFWSLPRP